MIPRFEHFIWREFEKWRLFPGCRWISLTYEQSPFAPLKRPMLRFSGANGISYTPANAPLFGRGCWSGFVPHGTRSISIAHDDTPEWAYRPVHARQTWLAALLPRAFRRNPHLATQVLGAVAIRAIHEHVQALGFARGGIPLENYHAWRASLGDMASQMGGSRPTITGQETCIALVMTPEVDAQTLDALLDQVRRDPHENWQVFVPEEAGLALPDEARVKPLRRQAPLAQVMGPLSPHDLVMQVSPEMRLAPLALAQLDHAAQRHADARVFYADEDSVSSSGMYHSPRLKPDWSPLFERHHPYLGKAVAWRVGALQPQADSLAARFDNQEMRHPMLLPLQEHEVHHLRRVLVSLYEAPPATAGRSSDNASIPTGPAPSSPLALPAPEGTSPEVSIVIANKNRLSLLKPCIESILDKSSLRAFEIIIVDNGSTDADVLAYYAALEARGAARVLFSPGPFNFSQLSNRGAAEARGHWLIFLNNDMEIVAPDWMEQLRQHALAPGIGAVGARLLFPDGTLQHGGVIVGLGGFADHIHHSAPGDAPGYLGRLSVPHELSAVTGACIAVEARKFHAVGGFDAENLPVELNDIDLCLKLRAAGWKTVLEPRALLIHHQSASRGRALLPFTRYGKERAYFRARWLDAIRDDPYFHPALSDFSVEPELAG